VAGQGHERSFWASGGSLVLDLGASYMKMFTLWKLTEWCAYDSCSSVYGHLLVVFVFELKALHLLGKCWLYHLSYTPSLYRDIILTEKGFSF
jgi:hypothetical protein